MPEWQPYGEMNCTRMVKNSHGLVAEMDQRDGLQPRISRFESEPALHAEGPLVEVGLHGKQESAGSTPVFGSSSRLSGVVGDGLLTL